MEYLGIFGFIAFMFVLTLQGKVSKLERVMREAGLTNETVHGTGQEDVRESLEKRIGKNVKFDFYEEEMDLDIISAKDVIIKDVDERWVLVHGEGKKKSFDKLVRISSIKGIMEV